MNDELGPRAEAIAVGGDAAPMQLDQGLDQGQPESDASRSVFLRALPESFEQSRLQLRSDPSSVVSDSQHDFPRFGLRG